MRIVETRYVRFDGQAFKVPFINIDNKEGVIAGRVLYIDLCHGCENSSS